LALVKLMNRPWVAHILSLVVVLASFGLRTWDLAGRPLWFDEAMEYWVATAPLSRLPEAVRHGIQDPPLYSLLLHLWMSIGSGEFVLRFLSVLFSTASVAGVIRIARRLSGPEAGLAAGALMAALPTEIRYAQEAGQYATMGCLITCSLVAIQDLEGHSRWQTLLLSALLPLGAAYTYYGAVLPVAATLSLSVLTGIRSRDWRTLRPKLGVAGVYALGITPLVVLFLPTQLPRGPTSQALQTSLLSPLAELRRLITSSRDLVAFLFTGAPWSVVPPGASAGAVALGLLLGVVGSLSASQRSRRWLLLTVTTWGIYYVAGALELYPYRFRYSMILAPLLIPLMAQGVALAAGSRWVHYGAVGLHLAIVLISLACLPNHAYRTRTGWTIDWDWPEEEGLPQAIDYWRVHGGATAPTYVYYGAAPAFRYHLDPERSLPDLPADWYRRCWKGDAPSLCTAGNLRYGQWLRNLDAEGKVASVQDAFEQHPATLWLLFSHIYPDEDRQILDGLSESYRIADVYHVKGAAAYQLKRSRR
jgi:4-amino-4-deoxy-L-arabinose transferase-like glycosyltransferase